MTSIRNIHEICKYELYYQCRSKVFFLILFLLTCLCLLHGFNLVTAVEHKYATYLHTREEYIQNGMDVQQHLEDPLEVTNQDNATYVDNPIKYDYLDLAISIRNVKPAYILSNTLEYLVFVFCTFLFAVYSIYIATYDFRFGTFKLKCVDTHTFQLVVGKLLSIFYVVFFCFVFVWMISYVMSFFLQMHLSNALPIGDFDLDIFVYQHNVFYQLLFSYVTVCFYVVLGFLLGFIFKSALIPIVVFCVYGFALPVLGKYDFVNIIAYFSNKVFSFEGQFSMFEPIAIHNAVGILILSVTTLMAFGILYVISRTRSSY